MARESWTDERLDDLSKRVDDGFKEMRAEFGLVRSEMREEIGLMRSEMREEFGLVRSEMREEIGSVRSEVGSVRSEIAKLNRTLIIGLWGFAVSAAGGVAAAVATHAL